MLGSIIGDIVGSIYEGHNIKTKEFELFSRRGRFTDDSVLTIATADWLLHGGEAAPYYAKWTLKFPKAGYGGSFVDWIRLMEEVGHAAPYNSCGNGSAMRIGPVGWFYPTEEETLKAAKISAECTHNHPEGIKGAQAIALCIFMARNKASKTEIKEKVETLFGYDLNFTIDGIRPDYGWVSSYGRSVLCQASVPQAIVAFLEGTDFEDSIRNAISIGGDSDTIGCMTGSIAEAYFGIPNDIKEKTLTYLPECFYRVICEFESTCFEL